jgi:hypothetical protein
MKKNSMVLLNVLGVLVLFAKLVAIADIILYAVSGALFLVIGFEDRRNDHIIIADLGFVIAGFVFLLVIVNIVTLINEFKHSQ